MIFVSHSQRDKSRPDGRLRELVEFLVSRGLPVWIDKPEEIWPDYADFRGRSLQLNGRWTDDIRAALRDCATGIGVWSVHAADRIESDPNGVLFQELNNLSVSKRLFLVNLDPDAMQRLDRAFRHLSDNQQCVDLSINDRRILEIRLERLASDLGDATGAQLLRTPQGGLDLFANHDPGVREARLSAILQDALNRQAEGCRERNLALRTFHRLLATFQTPSGFIPYCFDAARPGLGKEIEDWLTKQVSKQHERERPGYEPVSLASGALFDAAARLAEAEGASEIDERIYFLAIATEVNSGTIDFLKANLGPVIYEAIIQKVMVGRPKVPCDRTGDLDPIGG